MPITMTKNPSFLEGMESMPDPRVPGMVTYPLAEILLVVFSGIICGCDDWDAMVLFAREQKDWLRQFLPFKHGIASADTLAYVFRLLDTEALEQHFRKWLASLHDALKGVVAIDGKTLRGSKRDTSGAGALHLVSAYAHEAGLVLGQRAVAGKSNEITAIPELVDSLALAGTIVTIDAMGTQFAIVAKILAAKAQYILALKGNQGSLHDDVRRFFEEQSSDVPWSSHETTDSGHGRIEARRCTATDATAWLRKRHPQWQGLHSIVRVEASRYDKKYKKESREIRYFISSLPAKADQLLAAIRAHWSIENNLHWSLDVTFREDQNRARTGNAPANLAILRRAAYNTLKHDPTKLAIKNKQLKAALNNDYRTKLILC